jgi:hypothetical protein
VAWIRGFTATDVVTATTNPAALVAYPLHETNDIILLSLAMDGTNLPDLPSGYTNILTINGAAQRFRLCWKKALSAAEVCPTLNVSAGDEWHIVVIAVAGADYDDPINFNASRTTTDNAAPFTWTSGASTDETNVLIFHFCNSDTGLALTAREPFVNLVNGDCGSAGQGCAYTFQPASGAITDCTWTGRANDDTTACAVGINDDGNGTRPGYAGPSTIGTYLSALGGTSLIESDTNPASLVFGAIGQRALTQVWSFDGTSTYTDETTDAWDWGASDVTMTNATNAALYFGYDYKFRCMVAQVATAQSGTNYIWEYYNGSTWTTLTVTGVFTATGYPRIAWTQPSDWAAVDVNGVTQYYVRFRQTGTITTPPILNWIFAGGWPTTYDAIGNAADAGVNPYNDAIILSPGLTSNFSGCERLFGSAKDMDTGILVLHHKSVLPRDYAVDPSVNDQVYPVTNIGSGYGGFLVLLADVDSEFEAYSIHGKGAVSNSVVDWNVAAIGLNNGAEAFAVIATLNKSAVTRMAFLPQGTNGAISAHVSTLLLVGQIVVVGGSSSTPITPADLKWIATHCIGVNLLFSGIGTYTRVYAPMQIGGDAQTVIDIDSETFAMPTAYDGKLYFDWNADDNVAGWHFYGTGASDSFTFTNCIWVGSQPYRWEFNASHSGSAVLNFAGSRVKGATVTLRSTVALDGVTFQECPVFTLNAATLTDCAFVDTAVAGGSPGDADNISDSSFAKTTGTAHALVVTGTAANMTLDGVTFTGYASSDGSTGNEAIYVNIASGSMTINITGGGSTPSIRTAGATVTVVNARTVRVTAKDAATGSNVQGARVGLWATTGASVTISRSSSTATVAHTGHGYLTGQKVAIFGAEQGEYNGIKTITYIDANSYSYTVSGTPATPATGTITSHRVILDGDTSSSGIVEDTAFPYVSDLAVTGRVRRGTSAPRYKSTPVSGTITSAAGFEATAYMVSDA